MGRWRAAHAEDSVSETEPVSRTDRASKCPHEMSRPSRASVDGNGEGEGGRGSSADEWKHQFRPTTAALCPGSAQLQWRGGWGTEGREDFHSGAHTGPH